jgi:transposase-like protein
VFFAAEYSDGARVAGRWTYLYRAIDSAGHTIDFLLSPYRDALAANSFLQLALAQAGRIQPRVINVESQNISQPALEERRSAELTSRRALEAARHKLASLTEVRQEDVLVAESELTRRAGRL